MKKILLCFFGLLCLCTVQAQLQLDAPDGTYYVITHDEVGFATIAKFNSDGTPDLAYGTAGLSESINIWEIVGATIQSDGRIFLAGMTDFNDIHTDQAIAWVNTDGSILSYTRESLTLLSNDYFTSFEQVGDTIFLRGFSGSIQGNFGVYQIRVLYLAGQGLFSYQSPTVSPLELFKPENFQYEVYFNGNQMVFAGSQYVEASDGNTPAYIIRESILYIDGLIDLKSSNILDPNSGKYGLVLEHVIDGSPDVPFNENSLASIQYLFDTPLFITAFERKDDKIIVTAGETRLQFNSNGTFEKVLGDEVDITFNCPANLSVSTGTGICTALVNGIDPVTSMPADLAVISYTLSGATTGSGAGSASGLSFNKGVTTVTYSATSDPSNTCSFTVTVNDAEAPVVSSLSTNMLNIWPPNNKLVNVAVNYSATDNCGPVTTSLTVTSNETDNKPGDEKDWVIVNNHLVQLRAEKGKKPKDRLYTVTVKAMDAAGNQTLKSITIGVQKDPPAGFISYRKPGIDITDAGALEVSVLNNPSSSYFTIQTRSKSTAKLSMRVVNEAGGLVETRNSLPPNATLQVGNEFRSGWYVAEFMQGDERVTIKLLKR